MHFVTEYDENRVLERVKEHLPESLAGEFEAVIRDMKSPAGLDDPYLQTPRAAEFVGHSARTLENMRWRGDGPPYSKIGRKVVYRLSDLRKWVDARRVTNTGEADQL